jgi:hypothetical protein
MQLSDLDWKVRAALATSGIVFFFLVGLGAGIYFYGSARTEVASGTAALSPSVSVPAEGRLVLPTAMTAEKTVAPSPDQPPPPQAAAALPPVPGPRSIVPPPLPGTGELVAAVPAAPPPVAVPAASAPEPQPQPHPAPPAPAHEAAATRVALAAPPRPEAKPAPAAHAAKMPPHAEPVHPATAAPAASGPFRIQFGAFRREENARRLSQAITTPAMKVSVTLGKDHKGRPLYYVRSPAFADFARALAAAWDAQNTAQKQHFAEPITYLIRRVPTAEADATSAAGTTELAGGR